MLPADISAAPAGKNISGPERSAVSPCPPGLPKAAGCGTDLHPATKAESGHDENISFEKTAELIGLPLAQQLRQLTLDIYSQGCQYAASRGIIIADTKFEFGLVGNRILLIDEVMTPDSSRFWPADQWQPGRAQASFDKQFVRDWLEQSGWDKNSPPPQLPLDVVQRTSERYIEAWTRLTGSRFVTVIRVLRNSHSCSHSTGEIARIRQ